MHLIVTYDIIDDRNRTKLAKALEGFLNRVQKSIFEGEQLTLSFLYLNRGKLSLNLSITLK